MERLQLAKLHAADAAQNANHHIQAAVPNELKIADVNQAVRESAAELGVIKINVGSVEKALSANGHSSETDKHIRKIWTAMPVGQQMNIIDWGMSIEHINSKRNNSPDWQRQPEPQAMVEGIACSIK